MVAALRGLRRPVGPGWVAAAAVSVVLAAGAAYVAWWLATPVDCTTLPPKARVWTAAGLRPEVLPPCPVRDGDLVVGVDRPGPGVVRYEIERAGSPVVVDVPLVPPDLGAALREGWSIAVFTWSLFVLACYVFVRRRAEPAAGALLVFAGGLLASSAATMLGLPGSAADTGWRWLYLANVQVSYTLAWAGLVAFAVTFPTPLPWLLRRGRAAAVYLAPLLLLAVGALAVPGPLGSTGWVGGVTAVQGVITVAAVLAGVVITVRRFRVAGNDPIARQQLRWVGAGGWTSSALVLAGWFLPELITGDPLLPQGWIGLPGLATVAALGVAVLRYRLFDLDAVVGRSIVYAALTASVVALYLGVVTVLASILQTSASSPAAVAGAAVVAVAVNPLRVGLQRGVSRLLYGDRDDPYAALSRLSITLGSATASSAGVLPAAAVDVARAMRVPFVAIDLGSGAEPARIATAGTPPSGSELTEVPLTHRGEVIGRLVVAARAPGERPSAADRRLLTDLAGQVGAAAQVVMLNADLQRSRERLVLAREEERRALRRTLHDDIGPTVAGLALRAETVRRLLPGVGPDDRAATELGTLRRDATAAATDLRRLAYDLRPPALDELGLVGALTEHAHRLAPLSVTVAATPGDGAAELPAAVEVAAFRIAVEAMTNSARHSGAGCCDVRFSRPDPHVLVVEVRDDGAGLPAGFRAGVGVSSMRERAVELGGECVLQRGPGGGTQVTARLPIGGAR